MISEESARRAMEGRGDLVTDRAYPSLYPMTRHWPLA